MKTNHVWFAFPGIVALIALFLMVPSPSQAEDIWLAPQQPNVAAGMEIDFTGAGFHRDERVAVWATDPMGGVVTGEPTYADGDGDIDFTFDVPDRAVGGQWTMTARGDRSQVPVWASFSVRGLSPSSHEFQANVVPSVGPPGATFAFAANGFDDDEDVSYWVTDPYGKVYESFHQGTEANDDGRIDFTWTSPSDAAPGTWVMTMQGYDSDVARGIPFDIGWNNYYPSTPAPADPAATGCPPVPACPSSPTATAIPPTATPMPQPEPQRRNLVILPTPEPPRHDSEW